MLRRVLRPHQGDTVSPCRGLNYSGDIQMLGRTSRLTASKKPLVKQDERWMIYQIIRRFFAEEQGKVYMVRKQQDREKIVQEIRKQQLYTRNTWLERDFYMYLKADVLK